MKEKIIVYGASKTGRMILPIIEELFEIMFFIDGDKELWDSQINQYDIFSPEILNDYPDSTVFIATRSLKAKDEISAILEGYGVEKIRTFDFLVNRLMPAALKNKLNLEKTIDLGHFLREESRISLKELTYISGGSGVMDYAFLRVLALKYHLENYLEIGTYIGESINIMTDVCKNCYSITAPKGAPYHMAGWCKRFNRVDYSGKLVYAPNITSFYDNSQLFDYTKIKERIDLYFIDGDHSYDGVKIDTQRVFEHKKEDAFVVWHDFKAERDFNDSVVMAVYDALGEEFKNVYVTNNNMCGIYIPREIYQ